MPIETIDNNLNVKLGLFLEECKKCYLYSSMELTENNNVYVHVISVVSLLINVNVYHCYIVH